MTYIRFLAAAFAVATFAILAQPVEAGGSWGGSSGGSSGGSWGSSGGSSGGADYGSRGGSWGSSGGSSGSSGGSWGSSGGQRMGLFARLHARKAARRAARRHGSSGGSWGGSSGGSWGGSWGGSSGGARTGSSSWGSSGGSSGGYAYSQASNATPAYATNTYSQPVVSSVSLGTTAPYESSTISSSTVAPSTVAPSYSSGNSIIQSNPVIQSSPVIETPMVEQPLISTVVPSTSSVQGETILNSTQYQAAKPAVESDSAMLTVSVPLDAKVTVNDHNTTSDGSVRQFMSQGLKEGFVYTYVVKVTYDSNGEPKTESREVKLRAGESKELSFESPAADTAPEQPESAAQPAPSAEPLVTVVRLHVPAGSKVNLAGNDTKGNGVIRTFRTKQLKVGQQWTDYTVRVEAVINGQPVSQQRTIDVVAGSTNDLAFNFDNADSLVRN